MHLSEVCFFRKHHMIKRVINRSEAATALVLDWEHAPFYAALGLLILAQMILISLPVRADDSFRCVTLAWDADDVVALAS